MELNIQREVKYEQLYKYIMTRDNKTYLESDEVCYFRKMIKKSFV